MKLLNKAKGICVLTVGVFMALTAISLCGCSEMDENVAIDEDIVTDCIGLDEIDSPKRATVYETEFWEGDIEEYKELFLKENYKTYELKEEPGSFFYKEFYREKGEEIERMTLYDYEGFSFIVSTADGYLIVQDNQKAQELRGYFYTTMRFPEEPEKTEEYEEAVGIMEEYLTELGYPEYEIRGAAKVASERDESEFYYFHIQQKVDEIPFAVVDLPVYGNIMYHEVYNSGISREIKQYNSMIEVAVDVSAKEVIYWFPSGKPVMTKGEIKNYRIVSAEKAYQNVTEIYKKSGTGSDPRLEVAELQYKSIEKNGRKAIWPVWLFGISANDPMNRSMHTPGRFWTYYVVDAVSGEFFSDVEY